MMNLLLNIDINFSIESLLIGIVASILASIIVMLISFFVRPKIVVSKDICIKKEAGVSYLKVKIVNRSWFLSVTNIEKELKVFLEKNNGLEKYNTVPENYPNCKLYLPSRFWCLLHKKNSFEDYAVRLVFKYYGTIDKNSVFKLTIWGESSIFNAKKDVQKVYKWENLKTGHQFITGATCKTTKIEKNNF